MKIGIIGSNGFIGKNIKYYLSKKKEYKVFCFSSYNKLKNSWSKKILKEINSNKPDLIINCSASQLLTEDKKSIHNLLNSNIPYSPLSRVTSTRLSLVRISISKS